MLAHTNQVPACLVAPSPSEKTERAERILRLEERNRITIAIQKLKNIRK